MNLTQALHKGNREFPDRLATLCGPRRNTYATLYRRVARLAGALLALGVQRGDRVGMLGPNTDRYLEVYYACWWIGAVLNPINCRWNTEEIAYSLDDSDTQLLLIDEPFVAMTDALRAASRSLRTVVSMAVQPAGEALAYERLIAEAAPVADARVGGDELAALFYTGGTTGRPKGVQLSHDSLALTTLASICASGREAAAICLHALPMFHVGGMAVVLQAMAGLDTQVMLPVFDPAQFFELIARERITESALVPTMIKRVVDHPAITTADLSSLKRLFYGASPIDGTLLEQTIEHLPGVALTQFYGMTETAGIATALPASCHSASARARGLHMGAGLPTACVEVKVVDAQGVELPVGQIGEILISGPGLMKGYWDQPEQTQQVLSDGWMRTGDGGRLDENGVLYIVDRLKDMIVTGGENVYSVEVENAVLALTGVIQCAVIGVPDPKWGERVHAILVTAPGATVDAASVIEHCRQRIAGYKCPRSVEFRSELPISAAGKLLKYKLRDAYWQGQQRRVA